MWLILTSSFVKLGDLLDVSNGLAVAKHAGQDSALVLSLDHGLDLAVSDGDQNQIVNLVLSLVTNLLSRVLPS